MRNLKSRMIATSLFAIITCSIIACSMNLDLTPIAPVMKPTVSQYPSKTASSSITLFGKKGKGTDVFLGNREFLPIDDRENWSITVDLKSGINRFVFFSMDKDGTESDEILVTIERLDNRLKDPVVNALPERVSVSPLRVTGIKSADSILLVNGRMQVPAGGDELFAFDFSLQTGANILKISQVDPYGTKSAGLMYTIYYDKDSTTPPTLAAPMNGRNLQRNLLKWNHEQTEARYQVEISKTADFGKMLAGFPRQTTGREMLLEKSLASGTYFWRVGIVDKAENRFYSNSRRFTVGAVTGDQNNDGYPDILAGAPSWSSNSSDIEWGRAYLINGGEVVKPEFAWLFTGENAGDRFGASVNLAGDFNGDGFDDMVIGAPEFSLYKRDPNARPSEDDPGVINIKSTGRVYLFFGSDDTDKTPDLIFTGSGGGRFGYAVKSLGDINGDGFDDLGVTAVLGSANIDQAGDLFVYFGGTHMDNIADLTVSGEAKNDGFGWSLDPAGDFDGDGFMDVVVGAPGNDSGGDKAGRAYLYYGAENGFRDTGLVIDSAGKGFETGYSVTGAGDVNGDGFSDLLVTALRRQNTALPGSGLIYFGGSNPDNRPDIELAGESSVDMFGLQSAGLGDLNRDGFDDFVIMAPFSDKPGFRIGVAYLYLGGADMTGQYDILIPGDGEGELFGRGGGIARDMDADGFLDIIIGAPYNDNKEKQQAGRLLLFLGNERVFRNPVYREFLNERTGARFGILNNMN